MKERKKPTKSFIARSVEEIEKEALKVGYEAGFTKACEILHDFALLVRKMRKAQSNFYRDKRRDQYAYQNMRNKEGNVDAWIRENYNNFETDYEEE